MKVKFIKNNPRLKQDYENLNNTRNFNNIKKKSIQNSINFLASHLWMLNKESNMETRVF